MRSYIVVLSVLLAFLFGTGAQASQTLPASQQLASADTELDQMLSVDIADLTVTSASRREEKLENTPAAVYVITHEDLIRTGVTNIPDALRMVPGLEVAQSSSSNWAVTSRGFNGVLSDKLLVMIDGREIYTPVHSGVYWEDQTTLINDIDRIEVIRGPGSSLWGANAVNGVINIITKSAADTQGNYASAGIGSNMGFAEARHGGETDDGTFYRAYGQYYNYGPLDRMNGGSNSDSWYRGQGGFGVDGTPTSKDSYTLQGDAYGGQQNTPEALPTQQSIPFSVLADPNDTSYGGNVLARWNHQVSNDASTSLQAYIDHYSLLQQDIAEQHVSTADIQFQNNIKLDDRNNFVWGAEGRLNYEDLMGTFGANVLQSYETHYILSTFAQDEYALIPKTLFFTLGSKLEYNDETNFEFEPNARLAWHISDTQMAWAAVSRAVRTPSSIEQDVSLYAGTLPTSPPTILVLNGNSNQKDEDLIAYEIGHRIQPVHDVSFDTTAYYNVFTNLLAVGAPGALIPGPGGTEIQPYTINNLGSGHVYGVEEAVNWNVLSNWRLAGSYTYLVMELDEPPTDTASVMAEDGLAPTNQFSIRSYWNITNTVQWDNMLYYVSAIQSPADAYFRYDTRIGWHITPGVEVSIIGQNLLDSSHVEWVAFPQAEVPRTVLARVAWNF